MNSSAIESRLGDVFPNHKKIGPSILRAERLVGQSRYSILFFDYSNRILEKDFDLLEYQNRIVSPEYYKTDGALQWNHYLIFIVPNGTTKRFPRFTDLKRHVELDKLFARKYLIEESDLERYVAPESTINLVVDVPAESSPYNRWVSELSAVDLDGLHLGADYTAVLNGLLIGKPIKDKPKVVGRDSDDTRNLTAPNRTIEDLIISDFKRPRPKPDSYPLGTFTLLHGPNGTGKTSFLEAIEICLCGMTARNPKFKDDGIRVGIRYQGSKAIDYYEPDNLQKYRDRDLVWYENRYDGKNRINESFIKYNFFDTDNAARLSSDHDTRKELTNAFVSLSLGDKVNYLEERMSRFQKTLKTEINKLEKARIDQEKRKSGIVTFIKSLEGTKIDIASSYEQLVAEYRESKFRSDIAPIAEVLKSNLSTFVERSLTDLAHIEKTIFWLPVISSVSLTESKQSLEKDYLAVDSATQNLKALSAEMKQIQHSLTILKPARDALGRLEAYKKTVDVTKIVGLSQNLSAQESVVKRLVGVLDMVNEFELEVKVSRSGPDEALEEIAKLKRASELELKAIQSELSRNKTLANKSNQLIAEIKSKAKELLIGSPGLEDCPLCGTKHAAGILKQIVEGSNAVEKSIEILQSTLENQAKLLQEIKLYSDAQVRLLALVSASRGLPPDIKITDISNLSEVSAKIDGLIKEEEKKLKELRDTSSLLEMFDFSESEYTELVSCLEKAKIFLDVSDQDKNWADSLRHKIEQKSTELEGSQVHIEKGIADSNALVADIRSRYDASFSQEELRVEVSRRRALVDDALDLLSPIAAVIELRNDASINELHRRFSRLRDAIAKFNETQKSESERKSLLPLQQKELERVEVELTHNRETQLRLKRGLETLTKILEKDGKSANLSRFIDRYKKSILQIFKDIHKPTEFIDLTLEGSDILLKREDTGLSVPLTMISTGQRAALALAIFLTLNLSLPKGPPIILIDDPVAHTDDLNTLAFLDFLREIVASSRRQVVFATADNKLAQLIRRKFEFLGPSFRQYPAEKS